MSVHRPPGHAAPTGVGAGAASALRPGPAYDATLPPGATAPTTAPEGTAPTALGTDRTGATTPSAPPLDDGLAAGTMVHQFEIIGLLGRGGMGQVYLARDTRLGRKVALKFLLTTSAEATARFLVEARNTARCRHDNIVVVYEADTFEDAPYLALEYLDGRSLAEAIDGPLPIPRVLTILTAVARALVRAHADGLVHCDLKPENIVLTTDGGVKVLDFGIARILDGARRDEHTCGTPRFMSPEQWGVAPIDHRTDVWALGVIAWELLTGQHPLGNPTMNDLLLAAADLETALPRLSSVVPGIPEALDHLVARCLVKRKDQRLGSAAELVALLEALTPGRGRPRAPEQPPYPGMACFEEDDADRFFGRDREVARVTTRLADTPLVVLAGPSGLGKSSLVRAGVVPALKASGQPWEAVTLRPGRDPLHALAAAVAPLDGTAAAGLDVAGLAAALGREPGGFGARLRRHARARRARVLVFVDQLEELYTLTADASVRTAFAAALTGAADDPRAPVRVVVSVRSDFLDRLDGGELRDRLAEGLLLLQPMGPAELRAALERPLDATGFRFESAAIVDELVAAIGGQAGALPLVQFAAARLWDGRDRGRQLLTRAAFDAMGGLTGALASHAEDTVRTLPPAQRARLRAVLTRLVTAEGTRAVVERGELRSLGADVDALVDRLVDARLVAIGGDDGPPTVELVHESLIAAWPTLRRWRDEDGEDAALVAQIRTAALQWEQRERPPGLLWSGEALDDVRGLLAREHATLAPREYEFLDAGLEVADRAARRRRRLVLGGFVATAALALAAIVVALWVRGAERTAVAQRAAAEREATRARSAEDETRRQLAAAQAAEAARVAADAERARAEAAAATAAGEKQVIAASLDQAQTAVARSAEELEAANARLRKALDQANADRKRAEDESRRASALAEEAERARQLERKRADEAERKAAGLAKRLQ